MRGAAGRNTINRTIKCDFSCGGELINPRGTALAINHLTLDRHLGLQKLHLWLPSETYESA
jgi:hypothetical protein